jgi:hypothetical protein
MFEQVENTNRRAMLREIRDSLVSRTLRRSSYGITADDIHTLLDQRDYRGNRLSVIQTVLQNGPFGIDRTASSKRPEAKARRICVWTYRPQN